MSWILIDGNAINTDNVIELYCQGLSTDTYYGARMFATGVDGERHSILDMRNFFKKGDDATTREKKEREMLNAFMSTLADVVEKIERGESVIRTEEILSAIRNRLED